MRTPIIAVCALTLASPAMGVDFTMLLQPASSVDADLGTSTPLSGTLKGSYDVAANPGGTQTRPGLFGGSGNNPIPYTGSVATDTLIDRVPGGSFRLSVLGGVPVLIDALAFDLLSGQPAATTATMTVNWNSFHTVAPTAIFPGGTPIGIPIDGATITSATAVQTLPAPLTTVAQPDGSFTFSCAVPVIVQVSGSAQGTPIDSGPTPGVLPLQGSISIVDGVATLSGTGTDNQSQVVPASGQGFVDQPLDVPTVLPAGSTAHLLLSGTPGDTTVTSSMNWVIVASGVPSVDPADLDQDGAVSGGDLAILLALWGHIGTAADIDGDGTVGGGDLALMLAHWTV